MTRVEIVRRSVRRLERPRGLLRLALAIGIAAGIGALALSVFPSLARARTGAVPAPVVAAAKPEAGVSAGSLESAAAKASSIGRAIAMSLIALALAVAATVLAFRRDFKEAAGVFVVGVVAVVLATPTGLQLIRATVASLFGAG